MGTEKFEVLLHFTSVYSAKSILKSGVLRSGQLTNSDDPLESIYKYASLHIKGDNSQDIRGIDNEIELTSNTSTLCFSQAAASTTALGFLVVDTVIMPRMWAQYADAHRGVCLVFKKDKFLSSVKEKSIDHVNAAINYVKPNEMKEWVAEQGSVLNDFIKHRFQKHDDWVSQKEYRILFKTQAKVEVPIDTSLLGIVVQAECQWLCGCDYKKDNPLADCGCETMNNLTDARKWILNYIKKEEKFWRELRIVNGKWREEDLHKSYSLI